MYEYIVEKVNLKNSEEKYEVVSFLSNYNLQFEENIDLCFIVKDITGIILATASKSGDVLKCFAAAEEVRGENTTATLITRLIDESFRQGIYHFFIYTRPENINIFKDLNFKPVMEVETAALMEYGIYNIEDYMKNIIRDYQLDTSIERGAVVMNCNPFTKGHRFLIEEASRCCEELIVFIVEEDKSEFSFEVRYSLAKQGTSDLKNVKVIKGGEYIISQATFPNYFIKKEDVRQKTYMEFDSNIFGRYYGNMMNIKKRFVGSEPFCSLTREYNQVLKNELPQYGLEVIEIERLEIENKKISASKVRKLIKENAFEEISKLVPKVTYDYLVQCKSSAILEAREKRADFQKSLISKYNIPLVTLRVNYPGITKNNKDATYIFNCLSKEIQYVFKDKLIYNYYSESEEGPILFCIVQGSTVEIKNTAVAIEEEHFLGRLVDIDVYDLQCRAVTRKEIGLEPRKCYICEEMAHKCVRSKRHSEKDIKTYILNKIDEFKFILENKNE